MRIPSWAPVAGTALAVLGVLAVLAVVAWALYEALALLAWALLTALLIAAAGDPSAAAAAMPAR